LKQKIIKTIVTVPLGESTSFLAKSQWIIFQLVVPFRSKTN